MQENVMMFLKYMQYYDSEKRKSACLAIWAKTFRVGWGMPTLK